MKKLYIILLLIFIVSPVSAAIIFHDGFETEMIPYNDPGCSWRPVDFVSATRVQSPVRLGNYSNRMTINWSDAWGANPATELNLNGTGKNPPVGSEMWYAVSIFLSVDFIWSGTSTIMLQHQGYADTDLGESWNRNPIFALSIIENVWKVSIIADAAPVTIKGDYDSVRTFNLNPWEAGKWVDFVIHEKFSYESDGYTQIWQDGELVLDYSGANCFNDQVGPTWKHGVYEWYWRTGPNLATTRQVYFDEIKVGDSNSSYEEMKTPVDEEPPIPPVAAYKTMTVGGTKLGTTGGTKKVSIGVSSGSSPSVDFVCYFEGNWSDPTYTMEEISDVEDGDNTGTKESSATISTDQAHGGTHSLYIPSSKDNLSFDFAYRPSEFTVSMYVYIPSFSGNNQLFEIYCNDQNRYRCHVQSDGTVKIEYVSNGVWIIFITTATIPVATQAHIEIINSVAENSLSVRIADGSWESYTGGNTVGVFTVEPTNMKIGSLSLGACGVYIDDFKYKKAYEIN